MPSFQTVAEKCNMLFNSDNILSTREFVDHFLSAQSVGSIAVSLNLATQEQGRYLDEMPEAMGAALKALVAANLARKQPFGMQFLWFEGAEWEFLISEVRATDRADSRGGISLMLRSPKL